jgi:hypothetical protein
MPISRLEVLLGKYLGWPARSSATAIGFGAACCRCSRN